MKRKIRILQIACGFRKGVSGGVASFLNSYCATGSHPELHFDYLALGYQCFEPYRSNIETQGGFLYCLGIESSGLVRLKNISNLLKDFLLRNHYDIVHINTGSVPQMYAAARGAKAAGIKYVIAHSSSSHSSQGVRSAAYKVLKEGLDNYVDAYFACSAQAARSLFPSSVISKNKWTLITNAIDLNAYKFDAQVRESVRKELALEDRFVVGHVGRLNAVKNHDFLIDVFDALHKKRANAVLLLVGTGDLYDEVQKKVKEMGLDDCTIFLGQRNDVNRLLQAMDTFIFPSHYEGLGIVAIEAQASGLHTLMSEGVPPEADVTELAKHLPLNVPAEVWADEILHASDSPRTDKSKSVRAAGYDIETARQSLYALYEAIAKELP